MSMKPDLQPGTVSRLRPAASANRLTASSAWHRVYILPKIQKVYRYLNIRNIKVNLSLKDCIVCICHFICYH